MEDPSCHLVDVGEALVAPGDDLACGEVGLVGLVQDDLDQGEF